MGTHPSNDVRVKQNGSSAERHPRREAESKKESSHFTGKSTSMKWTAESSEAKYQKCKSRPAHRVPRSRGRVRYVRPFGRAFHSFVFLSVSFFVRFSLPTSFQSERPSCHEFFVQQNVTNVAHARKRYAEQVRGDPPVSMVAYWATDAEAVANPDGVQDPQQRTFAKIIARYVFRYIQA